MNVMCKDPGENKPVDFRGKREASGAKSGKQGGLWGRWDQRSRKGQESMGSFAQ